MGRKVWVPRVSGPLEAYASGFEIWLNSQAYSPSAAADRLYQFDQLSRWLAREDLGIAELTGEQAKRFVKSRRAAGLVMWSAPMSLDVPLGYLRGLGVAPRPAPVQPQGPLDELLADYHGYLLSERGLCEHTVFDGYGPVAELFLAEFVGPEGLGLERLSAAEVTRSWLASSPGAVSRGRGISPARSGRCCAICT